MSDDEPRTEIPYRLVETHLRVAAQRVVTTDPYAEGDDIKIEDLRIELVQLADPDTAAYHELHTGQGSQEITVTLRPDGRVQTVDYNHTGAGTAVVTAAAKVVAFVGGVALSAAKAFAGGALAGQQLTTTKAPPGKDPRKDWAKHDAAAAAQLAAHKVLAKDASKKLLELRKSLVTADEAAARVSLLSRISAVERTLHAARDEISRLESAYLRWRESQCTVHTSQLEMTFPVSALERRDAVEPINEPPEEPSGDTYTARLWQEFRLIIEVVDPQSDDHKGAWNPPKGVAPTSLLRWRETRPAHLCVWKGEPDGQGGFLRVPTQTTSITIVDGQSNQRWMALREGKFGTHAGTWSFGEDGAPASIHTADKSTAEAVALAISGIPDALAGGLEQAQKVTDALGKLQDAGAERDKAAAERELAIQKARVEMLGVNATAADAAELARAEQKVKLRTATRAASSGQDAVDDLKLELDQVTTQASLDAKRREATVDAQLADVKAEVARLEQEVLVAKAIYLKANPDKAVED